GGTGQGTLSGNTLAVTQAGTFVLRADQPGDADHNPAAAATATLTVDKAGQAITFNTPPPVTYRAGLTVDLIGDAGASSGLPVTYSLLAGGTGVGTLTGN